MRKEKIFNWLARIKIYGDVSRYYLSLIQFVLIAIGFVKVMNYSLPFIIILFSVSIVLLIGVVWFHVKNIMPEELAYLNRRDRMKMETLNKLIELLTKYIEKNGG